MTRTAGAPVKIGMVEVSISALGNIRVTGPTPLTDAHAVADAIRLVATEAGEPDPRKAGVRVKPLAWDDRGGYEDAGQHIADAIRALSPPPPEALLEAALRIPEVKALVDAASLCAKTFVSMEHRRLGTAIARLTGATK